MALNGSATRGARRWKGMVDLHTVKRVLALDLGMSADAIEAHLDQHWPAPERAGGLTLDGALQVVTAAEDLAGAR